MTTAPPWLREVDEAVEAAVQDDRPARAISDAYRRWRTLPAPVPGFTPFERSGFPTTHVVPSARLADLYATSSDVGSLSTEARMDLLERIRAIGRGLPTTLEFPARTVVDLCSREAD